MTFSWLALPHHKKILDLLAQKNGEGRFVGSAVRDSLSGRPIKDFDIATTHKPDQVEALLKAADVKVIPTGRLYGTLTAVFPTHVYEITTLRQDLKTDGRHAEVAFTTDWALDAARRDFTINALYLDQRGQLHDFHEGRADLEAGRVRFIGAPGTRISEDYLRILRFFRMHAFYGRGALDSFGLEACCAFKEKISCLSRERITHEFLRLLEAPHPWPLLKIIVQKEMLSPMSGLPPCGSLSEIERQIEAMAFLEGTGLKTSRIIRLKSLFPHQQDVPPHFRLTRREQKLWYAAEQNLFLFFADKIASGTLPAQEAQILFQRAQAKREKERETPFPLKGQDILDRGVLPGKEVGETLEQVQTWWRSSDPLPTREECLRYLAEDLAQKGLAMPQGGEET